ncbi:MAG: hypothetical protein ACREFQ_01055, partial [Stellaceae bacterium]
MSAQFYRLGSRRLRTATLAAGVALCFAGAPLAQAASTSVVPLNRSEAAAQQSAALPSFAPMAKRVLPAVVNITVMLKGGGDQMAMNQGPDQGQGQGPGLPFFPQSPFDQFLHRFFDQQGQNGMGPPPRVGHTVALGSGFIIDPSGYVVTNNHVVEN